ncbi:glycine cleavage system aminomethyltransferase GcvT [Sphingobium boeckii]|nr:glycine cleavage system aminomethyltransferase GcvT [Sphingobium boeckii]
MSEVPSENAEIEDEVIDTEAPLPLDAWHRARGARMVAFAGYAMPIQYEGIMAEHLWTREQAGLFDVSHMGQVLFTGEGAAQALEVMLPGEIQALKAGQMRYSLLLNEEGGILDDLMITRRADDLYMVVNGATKYDDIGTFRDELPDAVTINFLEDQALIALQGPKAVDALARIVPGVEALFFMQAAGFAWHETPLWISRSGYTGEDGFEISVPADAVVALVEAIAAQPEVKPIGLGARDSLRLEAGLPLYGHDLDENANPVIADLTFAIQKRRRAEGGFHGAETILHQLAEGAPSKRVGLTVAGRMPVREGAKLYQGDALVGTVTSGGFAPSVNAPIAMGYVTVNLAIAGTALEAEVRGKRVPVTVASMPFIPHRYHRKGAAK